MYNISALDKKPHRANLTWGLGSSYAYHVPRHGKYQPINYVSHVETNNKLGFVPTELTDRISRIYEYYLLMRQDYSDQLNDYRQSVLARGGYSKESCSNFNYDEINNKQLFERRLGREILIRMANCIKEAEEDCKNLTDSLEVVYLLISYVVTVRIPNEQSLDRSPVQRIVKWLATFWINRPIDERANLDQHIQLLESFQLAQFDEVLRKINQLLENTEQSQDFQNKLLKTRELIMRKVRFFGNGENMLLNSESYKSYIQDYVTKAKSTIQELFPEEDAEDPCYVILSVLSGNLETMRRLADNKWKVYILMYMAYYDPMMELNQLPSILEQYLAKINYSSKESLFAVRLFQPDMDSVIQCLLPVVPPSVICTVGFICHDLNLTKVIYDIDLLGMPFKKYLLEQMLPWAIQTSWQAGRPYLKEYSRYMKGRQAEQFLSEIMSRRFEILTIENQCDLDQFMHVCNQYRQLQIPSQPYVKSTLIRQIKSQSFNHILWVLDVYRRDCGQLDPLRYLFKMCVEMTKDGQFNYGAMVKAITRKGPFELSKIERIFKIFILMDRVRNGVDGRRQAFSTLLTSRSASMMPDEVISLLNLLISDYGVENIQDLQIQTQTFLRRVLMDGDPNNKHILQLLEETRVNYF